MRTPTDAELKEFLELQETIKLLTKRLDEIKEMCRGRGTFHTSRFACVVVEQSQERLAGLGEVCKIYDRGELEMHGLINRTVSLIVKVAPMIKLRA